MSVASNPEALSTEEVDQASARREAGAPAKPGVQATARPNGSNGNGVEAATAEPAVASAVMPLSGRPMARERPAILGVLGALSGYLVIRGIVLLLARYLMGHRRTERFHLEVGKLRREHRTQLLGRTIREGEEFLGYGGCISVGRETRFSTAVVLVGMAALLLGTMVGVGWVYDGVQGGLLTMILTGVGILLGGVVVDALLLMITAGGPGRVIVSIRFTDDRVYRVAGVRAETANRFVRELSKRLPKRLDR